MTAFDHLLAVALLLVFPALSAWDAPRLARRVIADPVNARTNAYTWNMVLLWSVTFALIAVWWWIGRPIRDAGLHLPDSATAWVWTILITGAAIALFAQQALSALKSPDAREKVRAQLASQPGVRTVLPSTPRELQVFHAAAITAGICEEVLYRGFLLWYFQRLLPGGIAIAAAIVAFGLAHTYQGLRGIAATGTAGAIAMAVYLLTGSLLAPILLHVALDLVNGSTMYRVLREEGAPGSQRRAEQSADD